MPKPPLKAKQLPELSQHAQVAVCDWSLVSVRLLLNTVILPPQTPDAGATGEIWELPWLTDP